MCLLKHRCVIVKSWGKICHSGRWSACWRRHMVWYPGSAFCVCVPVCVCVCVWVCFDLTSEGLWLLVWCGCVRELLRYFLWSFWMWRSEVFPPTFAPFSFSQHLFLSVVYPLWQRITLPPLWSRFNWTSFAVIELRTPLAESTFIFLIWRSLRLVL